MQAYFENLGAQLEKAWSAIDRDEEGFSEIAQAALKSSPPLEQLDIEALVDHLLDPGQPIPRQLAPPGVFGQPGVTVFYGQGFVVDVYFWTQSLSAIHDHPFCGAFTLLKGFSVHARYRWEEHEKLNERTRLGKLALEALEMVKPGDTGVFGRGRHPLVHALLHVPIPSVSMVVRTVRTEGYLRYFPPGVAMAMDAPGDLFERAMMLLDSLRSAGDPDFGRRFAGFLRTADFEITFRALSRMWFGLSDNEKEHWLAIAGEQHGSRVDAIRAALDEAQLSNEAETLRARLTDPDDRFIATSLMLADRRESLLELVSLRHPQPIASLHRFVDESGIYTPEEEASAILAHALIDGEDADGALGRVVENYGAESVAGREEEIRGYYSGCAFARLAR